MAPGVGVAFLGRIGYRAAWQLQEALRRRVWEGAAAETLLLCEHDPVITLGRSACPEHVRWSHAELAARGIAVVATSRGGSATFHGPGQLVAYPVLRVDRGAVAHVTALAQATIDLVRPLGVAATFRREAVGVWTERGKLAAIGIHIGRRVAVHGVALNVATAPSDWAPIVPCGLAEARVTSLLELVPDCPSVESLAPRFGEALAAALRREIDPRRRALSPPAALEGLRSLLDDAAFASGGFAEAAASGGNATRESARA